MVRGDKDSNYGEIMNVVSSINAAGYNHISLITQLQQNK